MYTVFTMSQASRDRYRHGDLRQALLDAGLDMAREGGPDAIVLREEGDRFLLLSASSSAESFLHAVETSLENVV